MSNNPHSLFPVKECLTIKVSPENIKFEDPDYYVLSQMNSQISEKIDKQREADLAAYAKHSFNY